MARRLITWLQGPMRRIFPDDAPPKGERGRLLISAARGEVECFQVGVRTEGEPINFLTAEAADLRGPKGARIPAANVDLLFPEYVPVKWPCAGQARGDVERVPPAFFPDPLLPEWRLDVAGPQAPPTRSVWVRVRVPPDAPPGIFRGAITLTGGRKRFKGESPGGHILSQQSARLRFALRVWDFALPARSRLLLTNWFFPYLLADWYGVKPFAPEFWRLLERVADDMAGHRQNVVLTPYFGGQQPDEQLVGVRRSGRRYSFDFARLDRWFRLFLQRGFERLEGQHVAAGSRRPVSFWQTTSGGARKVAFDDAADARFEGFLAQFIAALWAHLDRRGWQQRLVQHLSDEPGLAQLPRYRRLAQIVRGAAPGIRLLDAITDPEFGRIIDYPVPLESFYQRVLDGAGQPVENVWTYYCCGPDGPWPNRFIEYLPIRWRIFTWLCWRKGIPGFLHWGYNWWAGVGKKRINPWDDTTGHRHPGGDPFLIYPPRDDRAERRHIYGSIRWEIIREAMEDYEYLRMTGELAESGDPQARAILKEVSQRIVPDWTTHTRDEKRLLAVREKMGELLSRYHGRRRAPARQP